MMKNWDFVDPKLARKLKQLTKQIQQFKQKRVQIMNNNRISETGKKKLLEMNQGYISDLMNVLKKQQQGMIDYFDKQLAIVTKKEVKQIKSNQFGNKDILCDQTTGIEVQNDACNNSYSLNKTKLIINLGSSQGDKERKYRFDQLSTTGRIKIKRPKQPISSFELNETIRRQSQDNTYSFRKQKEKAEKPSKRRRGSIMHIKNGRMKRKILQKEFEIEMQRLLRNEQKEKIKQLEKQRQEDKQIIQLLYQKMKILQNKIRQSESAEKKRKRPERAQVAYESDKKIQQGLKCLKRNYEELQNVLKQNKELQMKRKQLIKINGK